MPCDLVDPYLIAGGLALVFASVRIARIAADANAPGRHLWPWIAVAVAAALLLTLQIPASGCYAP